MKKRIRQWAALALSLILLGTLGAFPALAEETTKQITLTTNSDVNPFIRIALYSETFSKGGPFTVRMEMNISKYTKKQTDANVFINIVDGRDKTQQAVWLNTWKRKTSDWVDVTDENGQYITFNNINKVMIDGVFQPFALLQFGAYYADCVIAYRNFRILNAAGSVVYSWDTDTDLQGLSNLKNYEGTDIFWPTFGDGSADYTVSDAAIGGNSATTTTKNDGPIYEDPTPTKPTTTKAAVTTKATDAPVSVGEITTVPQESDATEPSDMEASAIETTASDPYETRPSSAGESSAPSTDKKKGGSVWVPVGIILGVLAAAGAVVLVLWKTGRLPLKKKPEDTDE